jgi:TrmH RNA methyltransferase
MTHNWRPQRQKFLASGKLLRITGLPAVQAVFAAAPERVEKLFFDGKASAKAGPFCAAMARARRPYRQADENELAHIAGTILHGGMVALVRPRPVEDFAIANPAAWLRDGLLLVLDGVSNPHNFGAIVRTAAFMGVRRIILSDHPMQALPSDASYRVAEGGMEYVELYRTCRFTEALRKLRRTHRLVATAAENGRPLRQFSHMSKPVALILGNEQEGLARATLGQCDDMVTIPGTGCVQSLNVSASAAILIYALAIPYPL